MALLQDDKEYQWKHKIPEQRYNSIQEFYISAGKWKESEMGIFFFFLAIIPLLEWELYDKVFTGLIYEFLLIYSLLSGTNSMSGLLSSHQQDMFR